MKKLRNMAALLLCCAALGTAQEFGFGGSDDDADGGEALSDSGFGFGEGAQSLPSGFKVNIGGEVSAQALMYRDALTDKAEFKAQDLGDLAGARLNLEAVSDKAEAFVGVKFDGKNINKGGLTFVDFIDEAYLSTYYGSFEAEAGLRKLTWGRADSQGPLDVINPLDYSDLTDLDDQLRMKMARPMLHLSYRVGAFTKVEGVIIPWFRAHRFAVEGRWTPSQVSDMVPILALQNQTVDEVYFDEARRLDHFQGGLRFTTTAGPADIGIQYYTGYFFRPAVSLEMQMHPILMTLVPKISRFTYNRFHLIGADTAFVLWGFNYRSEAGILLTEDTGGDDPEIENPAVVYSFGFDRDLVWGINLNLQVNGKIRLFQDEIAAGPIAAPGQVVDTEASIDGAEIKRKSLTSNRLTGILSKKIFRDELELKATAIWGIEDKDFLIVPAVIWTRDALSLEASGGIFGGDTDGELGQYWDNSYVKLLATYTF
jgi:hypothetical protein